MKRNQEAKAATKNRGHKQKTESKNNRSTFTRRERTAAFTCTQFSCFCSYSEKHNITFMWLLWCPLVASFYKARDPFYNPCVRADCGRRLMCKDRHDVTPPWTTWRYWISVCSRDLLLLQEFSEGQWREYVWESRRPFIKLWLRTTGHGGWHHARDERPVQFLAKVQLQSSRTSSLESPRFTRYAKQLRHIFSICCMFSEYSKYKNYTVISQTS